MDPRETDLRRLFDIALDLPPTARVGFLDRECKDQPDLRRRLETMLEAAGDERFLADPSWKLAGPATAVLPATALAEGPGTRIGPYKLLQVIGEGGFGVVFLAEQETPVRRRVALKVIKLGMDTRQVIARFEAERQALAMMDHPNIAHVLDAGSTDSGRPFFVMELVKGVPITEFCDLNRLSPKERLKLFLPVCHAVQHAHQKGVIHRDLKPSNILVTLHDGQPVPKVIDFGLAKATDHRLTERTLFTEHGALLGTPAYMSPEQAELSGLDIDTRTDVYSLGVLLYELLTGTTPFPVKALLQAGLMELQRVIREDEPPKPSTRVTTQAEQLASVAALRRMEPQKLGLCLRGDLDWIIMRCLEKQRSRRYATAVSLADDLRRHLEGDAVEAAPPSVGYRLRKFVRRRRGQVVAIAAVLLTGLLGTVVAVLYALEAGNQARAARSESAVAKEQRQRADRNADEALVQAETARKKAREARAAAYFANIALAEAALEKNEIANLRRYLAEAPEELRGWEWHYLNARADTSLLVIHGTACAVGDPSSDRFAVACDDHTIRVFDAVSGRETRVLRSLSSSISKLVIAPHGDSVAAAELGQSVHLWNVQDGAHIAVREYRERVLHLAINQDGSRLAVATANGTVELFETISGRALRTLPMNPDKSPDVEFSPDGRRLIAVGVSVRVWDIETEREVFVLHHGDRARYSFDGSRIVTSTRYSVELWDGLTGEHLGCVAKESRRAEQAAFNPDGTRIVTVRDDGSTQVWDVATDKEVLCLRGDNADILDVSYDADGSAIATASASGTARVWDTNSGAERCAFPADGIGLVRFVSRGQRVVTVSSGKTIRLWGVPSVGRPIFEADQRDSLAPLMGLGSGGVRWDGSEGGPQRLIGPKGEEMPVTAHKDRVHGVVASPDGRRLATTSFDNTIHIWDTASKREVMVLRGHASVNGVSRHHMHVVYSVDGARMATADWDKTAHVWDADTGRELLVLRGHEGSLASVEFSRDGSRLVTASSDKTARIWDAHTGATLAVLAGHDHPLTGARFNRDATRVLTITDSVARVFAVHHAGAAVECEFPCSDFSSLKWSDDGSKVLMVASRRETGPPKAVIVDARSGRFTDLGGGCDASFGSKSRIALWTRGESTGEVMSTRTGELLYCLRGHARELWSCALNQDQSRIVTASSDQTVRIWDAVSGRQLLVLRGHGYVVRSAQFTDDGTRIVTVSDDGSVRVWDSVAMSVRHREAQDVADARLEGERVLQEAIHKGEDVDTIADDLRADKTLSLAVRRAALDLLGERCALETKAAQALMESLLPAHPFPEDLAAAIGAHPDVAPVVRAEAKRLVRTVPDSPWHWESQAWKTGRQRSVDPERVRLALRMAERAAGTPEDIRHRFGDRSAADFLRTLGVVQYRAGLCDEAVSNLTRSIQIRPDEGGGEPVWALACLAMALHQLGRSEEAHAAMARLHQLELSDEEERELVAEASALVGGH